MQENGEISFRSLRKWNMGQSLLEDFVDNGTRDTVSNKSISTYFKSPLKVAKEAITTMAKKGFVHNDLKWAHVGLLPYKSKRSNEILVKPILIDLHDVRPLHSHETTKDVVNAMLEQLNDY